MLAGGSEDDDDAKLDRGGDGSAGDGGSGNAGGGDDDASPDAEGIIPSSGGPGGGPGGVADMTLDASDAAAEPSGKASRRDAPHASAPRFDFHDFPRKTDQADDANAAVNAEVRERGWRAKHDAAAAKAAAKANHGGSSGDAAGKEMAKQLKQSGDVSRAADLSSAQGKSTTRSGKRHSARKAASLKEAETFGEPPRGTSSAHEHGAAEDA